MHNIYVGYVLYYNIIYSYITLLTWVFIPDTGRNMH